MRCHVCDVAVSDGQRFCHECGASLDGVTDATAQHDVVVAGDRAGAADSSIGGDATTTDAVVDPDATIDLSSSSEPGASSATLLPPVLFDPSATELSDPAADLGGDPAWWAPDAEPDGPGPDADGLLPTQPVTAVPASMPEPMPEPEPSAAATIATDDTPWPTPTTTPPNPLDAVPWATDEPDVSGAEPLATSMNELYTAPSTPPQPAPAVDAGTTSGHTTEMPVTPGPLFDGAAEVEEIPIPEEPDGFKLRASFVFSFLAVLAVLMSSIADMIDIRTSLPIDGIDPGIRNLEDFGTNMAVGGFIGAALMLIGGLAACFGARWGAGLAGGAGLAVTGWAGLALGLVERPIFAAQSITRDPSTSVTSFTLTVTRDIGWFLVLGVGVLGLLVFLVSLRQSGTGGRAGLNPWIAAIGGLGSVVLAAGPLIPLGDTATLQSNLGFPDEPDLFFIGRLVQLALLVITGVLGFLSVRTYGLGLAAGGLSVAIWLWATTLAGFGEGPIGPALGNLGSLDTSPHAVTGVGVAVSLLMLAIATTIAVVTRPRHS